MSLRNPNRIINEGYLLKKGVYNTSWQRRYFVLYADRTVDYFKDETYVSDRKKAKGTIRLTEIQRIELVQYLNASSSNNQQSTRAVNNKQYKQTNTIQHTSFTGVVSSLQIPPDYQYENPLKLQDSKSETLSEEIFTKKSSIDRPQLYRSKSETLVHSPYRKNMHRKCSLNSNYSSLSNYSIGSNYSEYNSIDNPMIDTEFDDFENVLNNSISGLKCNRMYSFALISNMRQWILSAENTNQLKSWICKLDRLSQGPEIHNGYLNTNKYFVLYKHKVLHCYKDKNRVDVIHDIDLEQMLYLKYEPNSNEIQIGLSENSNVISLIADNGRDMMLWVDMIESIFDNEKILKYKYCSLMNKINITHDMVVLACQPVAIFTDYMVIFKKQSQCDNIKNILYFKKITFRNYIHKEKCILIPLRHNTIARRASKKHGKYTFCVSNGNKKYYFCVGTKQILNKWIDLLSEKRSNNIIIKTHKGSSSSISDVEIESKQNVKIVNLSESVHSERHKKKILSFRNKTDLINIRLSPIIDNHANKTAFPDTFTPMKEYQNNQTSGDINDDLNHWKEYLKLGQ